MLMIREVAAAATIVPEFSLEALATVVSPATVEAIIDAGGVREQRQRKLPAVTTIFFCIAMNLYATTSLGQVFTHLVSGLRWLWPHPNAWRVSTGALCHARARLAPARWWRSSNRCAGRWCCQARTARRAPSWAGGV